MEKLKGRQQVAYLPLVLCTTFVVAICPVILVWWLRDAGWVSSVWVGTGVAVAASFAATFVGAAVWKTRTGSPDVLFSDLMLWGFLQRRGAERRLAAAAGVLGLTGGTPRGASGERPTHEQRTGLLTQLASALETRDPYTHGHSRRVARHASNIAKRMGLPAAEVTRIRTAGLIHDVGKVKVPTAVLHKEAKLTDEEFEIVKRHSVEGARMVSDLGDDDLTAIVRHHHERLDGTGYPDRLVGDSIPLGARILAVADTFDAITSTRPYRRACPHRKAFAILEAEAGSRLDPDSVRAFFSCYAGSRPLALWNILAHGSPRLASWLGTGLGSAKAASLANVILTAGAVAAVSGAVLGPPAETPDRPRVAPTTSGSAVTWTARHRPSPLRAARDGDRRPVRARGSDDGHEGNGAIPPARGKDVGTAPGARGISGRRQGNRPDSRAPTTREGRTAGAVGKRPAIGRPPAGKPSAPRPGSDGEGLPAIRPLRELLDEVAGPTPLGR